MVSSLLPSITSIAEITLPELLPFAIPAAIIAPFITYALAKKSDITKRKLEYRTFIDMAEITDDLLLENLHKKPGTKVIMPEDMPPLGEMKTTPKPGLGYHTHRDEYKFLKIKPFGKSIITSGNLSIKMTNLYTGEPKDYSITLPILDVNEEIIITLYECTGDGSSFSIDEVEMQYRTQAGEELVYKRNSKDHYHTDSHKVKKPFRRSEVIERNKGTVSKWRYA